MVKNESMVGREPRYRLHDDGAFVIENYNEARTFASFFPGIAGLHGIPLWAFYVNRNQCVASFGVKNKSYSITEFYPANTAYGLTATAGFRTFIKGTARENPFFYEPFATVLPDQKKIIRQTMRIRPWELELEDDNSALGLKTTVKYFTLPEEPLAALVRIVTVENTGSSSLQFQVVDGHPRVLPYWLSGDILKGMSYTAQAWAEVCNLEEKGIPFYKLKVEISDRPEVTVLKKGNFYFGYINNGKATRQASVIVDPDLVFGTDVSLIRPAAFFSDDHFSLPRRQMGDNKYACAMSFFAAALAPGKSVTLNSMIGHISDEDSLNRFARKASRAEYFTAKARENRNIIEQLTGAIGTWSGKNTFDQYCRQSYLDNLLRGGMPILLPAGKENKVCYVYSRKHGDLERDYNFFQVNDSYYSHGNGNYRDMNQNKRNDIFFNPRIGDHNVVAFYDLMQLDGGNPLIVKGTLFSFELSGKKAGQALGTLVEKENVAKLEEFLAHPFDPGGLLLFIEHKGIRLLVKSEAFLSAILEHSRSVQDAEHGEGYWTDHWTYNLDLLESFLSVYPEKEREILFKRKSFTFFDNDHIVLPRSDKHVLAGSNKVRQFGSVVRNEEKAKLIGSRKHDKHLVHDNLGKGKVYATTLIGKMVCLLTVKLATLDPDGIGIEMEADKPGWYDALNGLPGVFGSSVSETFELKRMIQFVLDRCEDDDSPFAVPEELSRFFTRLETILGKQRSLTPYAFWDAASTAKEEYRAAVMFGVSGRETVINGSRLRAFLSLALDKINNGLARAIDRSTGLYYTYFSYEAKQFKKQNRLSHKGLQCVKVGSFTRHPLPLFLEGEVHYMKTERKKEKIKKLFTNVRNSALYDRAIGMYKVNASLAREPKDLGRCTVFSPGWLENESIWLHMEYKYLLELLKAGLYLEFFDEFARAGICFQDPVRYGRSILENSSFITSSAFPDPANHGRGFVARLSGSTAELIHIWLIMTAGHRPFTLNGDELELRLSPVIPSDYFTREGTFSFMFLGKTRVTYCNRPRTDTFASDMAIQRLTVTWNNGQKTDVEGPVIRGTFAERIRNQEAKTIEAYY